MRDITYNDFIKLDLRIAIIRQVKAIERADKLLQLTLDVGDASSGGLGEKVVVSGIKSYYSPEELIGKRVVYLANLESRRLRGVVSQGMILAASKNDAIVLLTVDGDIAAGASVS